MSDSLGLRALAEQAAHILNRAQGDAPSGGSLTVVGTGIRSIAQLSIESLTAMVQAEVLWHVIGIPEQEAAVLEINPAAQTMIDLYADGVDRSNSYEAMVQRVLDAVQSGKRTVAAFYGHPGVFTYPTHESVRRVRAAGFPARMLPAVSSADCLYADLGVDPGDGCQQYEATDFLYGPHPVDLAAHLFIWQAAAIGNLTYEAEGYDMSLFPSLVAKLLHSYPAGHPVGLYEASFEPTGAHRAMRVPLYALQADMLSAATTLHLPPVPVQWRAGGW